MEADRGPAEIVSLEDVRARFLEAEDHLRRVAASVQAASKAGAELRESRASLKAAAEALVALATAIGTTAAGFADHDAALRRAIDLLAAADPAAIREDVALLRSIASESREVATRQAAAIAQSIGEVRAAQTASSEATQASLSAIRREGLVAIVLGALTLVGVAVVLILSRL